MSTVSTALKKRKQKHRTARRKLPTDCRKQLFNAGHCGPIGKIQVSLDRVVQLNGILYDIDPPLYRASPLLPKIPKDPERFYKRIVKPWLTRHPVLAKAEVRMTGSGLHVIPMFDKPVEFEEAGERERWAGIVEVVQAALPIDPDQPGITATTRAIGSVNGKNKHKVRRLKKGEPVTQDEVLGLYEQMISAPFRTVATILAGSDRISPCPFCNKEDSTLTVNDHVGHCYGKCGKVHMDDLYDLTLKARSKVGKE